MFLKKSLLVSTLHLSFFMYYHTHTQFSVNVSAQIRQYYFIFEVKQELVVFNFAPPWTILSMECFRPGYWR